MTAIYWEHPQVCVFSFLQNTIESGMFCSIRKKGQNHKKSLDIKASCIYCFVSDAILYQSFSDSYEKIMTKMKNMTKMKTHTKLFFFEIILSVKATVFLNQRNIYPTCLCETYIKRNFPWIICSDISRNREQSQKDGEYKYWMWMLVRCVADGQMTWNMVRVDFLNLSIYLIVFLSFSFYWGNLGFSLFALAIKLLKQIILLNMQTYFFPTKLFRSF